MESFVYETTFFIPIYPLYFTYDPLYVPKWVAYPPPPPPPIEYMYTPLSPLGCECETYEGTGNEVFFLLTKVDFCLKYYF